MWPKIIFDNSICDMCIGINQKNLDLFSNLPLRPVSGNSILAEVNFNSTHIVNNKISVINTSKNNVHAGSTYHNGFENMGTEKIEKQLKEIVQKKYNNILIMNPTLIQNIFLNLFL